jgi:LuxR family maltose regulon positive regulatory protein
VSADLVTSKSETIPARANSISSPLPLVMTKIRIPRRRPELLSRRRLADFIHAHLDCKLILISAPAGYGKTSLLTDFAYETDLPVCWYTLDPFDRDLRVFLEHLIAAIARQFPAFGERSLLLLRETPDPKHNLQPMVATLVREIYDTIPEYFVLILDDYHAVEEEEKITEFLDLLVTYIDENCHFILASRTLPALPNLSLLLTRKQATGLSIDELRFTPQEVKSLAQQNYDLELTLEDAAKLAEQTEGWITGLLLTAAPRWEKAKESVTLRGRINIGLYDYLSKQVLDQQPPPLREFLLASSVLDELSQELCTSVLGVDRPADLMDQLRTRNLFVIEFEGDEDRLRYHDLFREFLQANLRRQDGARFQELTRRAAQVYASRGEWQRAVSRYLMLQDYKSVADIVEQIATRMYETGRWDTLAGWIDALPETIKTCKPDLLIQRGKIHAERGEHTLALAAYHQAKQAFIAAGDKAGLGSALVREGCVLRFQGRYAEAKARCQEALALVGGTTPEGKSVMALAHKQVGLCLLGLGQLTESLEALQQSLKLYEELETPYDIGMIYHDMGMGHELAGDLDRAVIHYRAALQRWQLLGNLGPWANTLNSLGVIHYLQGKYEQASQLLNEALSKVQQANNLRVEACVWASLGDLHCDLGAYVQAQQAYTEGLKAATRVGEGFAATYTLDGLGNLFRLQGNLAHARQQLLEALQHAEQHGSAYETGLCYTSLGILASAEGNLMVAHQQLSRAAELFEAGGFRRELARTCLHQAQVAFLAGEGEKALTNLERALTLVTQLGFDQFLVVEGQQLQPLLRFAASQKVGGKTVSLLLKRIKAHQLLVAKRVEPVIRVEPQLDLRIYALGQAQVELGGKNIQWVTAQSRDIFFCLLQHPQGLRKEELGGIFWPEHSPQKLDAILRSSLYRLRRAIFRESIVFEDSLYRFNWKCNHWFDVKVFEKLLDQAGQTPDVAKKKKSALLEEALALYRGDYLSGVYADWCVAERDRLRERCLAALEELAKLKADQGELQRAVELYQSLLAQDQYYEVAHRELMRCYYRQGDRASAIRQYQACARILREEMGLSPMPETEKLYQLITAR